MNRRAFKKKMDDYYQLINGNTDPVTLYLESLAPTGRRSMRSLLNTAVGILGIDDELEHIPWQSNRSVPPMCVLWNWGKFYCAGCISGYHRLR